MPFRDVIGQTRAVGFLQGALKTGRIAHAYLFSGPAGVGKRVAALALAQALNCQRASSVERTLRRGRPGAAPRRSTDCAPRSPPPIA